MTLRFTLRQLEYLVAVGDAGSIAQAAQTVNVSSPSISAAISQLEAELGVQLFVRHHAQGLSLTSGGQRIVNEARQILSRATALTKLAGDIRETPRGTVSLGCLATLAPFLSAALRRSFEDACPEAQLRLHEGDQARLLEMLRRAEIDVALTYDLEIPPDIAFDGLTELPLCVMLAEGHPLAGRDRLTLTELEAEPLVLLDLPLSRDYFLSMFHAAGLRPRIASRTADFSVLRSLVANGFGYALLNFRTRLRQAPDGGGLTFVTLDGASRPLMLGLATVRAAHSPRVLGAFRDHVSARFAAQDIPGMSVPET